MNPIRFALLAPVCLPLLTCAALGSTTPGGGTPASWGGGSWEDPVPPTRHPYWWITGTPPVLDPGAVQDNSGAANIGQAKHMAKSALDALRSAMPDVADRVEAELVGPGNPIPTFEIPAQPDTAWRESQRAPLQIGQLKAISEPFYRHLNQVAPGWLGYQLTLNESSATCSIYPWLPSTTGEVNLTGATVGQLKSVFSLRFSQDINGDGFPDLWSARHLGTSFPNPQSVDPNGDADGDGIANSLEFALGLAPNAGDIAIEMDGVRHVSHQSGALVAYRPGEQWVDGLLTVPANVVAQGTWWHTRSDDAETCAVACPPPSSCTTCGANWTELTPTGDVLQVPTPVDQDVTSLLVFRHNSGELFRLPITWRKVELTTQNLKNALAAFTLSNTGQTTGPAISTAKAPLGFGALGGTGGTGSIALKKSAVTGSYFLNVSIAVVPGSGFTPADYTYRIFSGFRLPGEFPKGGASGGPQSLPGPFSPIPDGTETYPLPVIQAPFPANGTATVELVPQYVGDGPFLIQVIPTPPQNDNGNSSEILAENTAEGYSTCVSCTSCISPRISLQDTPVSLPLGPSGGYDPTESDGSPSPQPRHSACEADGELTFNIPTLYDPTASAITNPGLPGIGMLAPKGAYQASSPNANTIEIQGERKFVIEKTPVSGGDQNALTITAYAIPGNVGSKYLTLKIEKNLTSGALEIREYHGTSTTAKLHVFHKESSGSTVSAVLYSHDGARQLRREFTPGGNGSPHTWVEIRREMQIPSGGGAAVAIHDEALRFRRYSCGVSRVEVRTIDPAGAALTTRCYYYENGDDTGPLFGGSAIGAGRLKRRVGFDGHLTTAQYGYGISKTFTPYADNPSGSLDEWEGIKDDFPAVDDQLGDAGSLVGNGDKIKVLHTSSVAALNGPAVPSVTGQQWGGSAVVVGKGGIASASLYRMPRDTHAPGRISRVLEPSGRLTTVTYNFATGVKEIVTESGEPDTAGTEVVKGERVTLTTMSCGRVLSEVVEGFDDLTEKASPVYLTGRYAGPTDFDDLGRPLAIHYNGYPSDDRETFTYACCGVENHISRRGRVTTYGYDALGRIQTTTVKRSSAGTATLFTTARSGLTVTESRNGTQVSSRTTDLARRVVSTSSPDEDGDSNPETTTYSYTISSRGIVTTATDALGGTSVTWTHPDGRTAAVWGTAVPDRVYRYSTGSPGGCSVITQYLLRNPYHSTSGDISGETEWASTAYDADGRAVATWDAASGSQHKAVWNYSTSTGLLDSSVDPDGVIFSYLYHPDGSLQHTIQNLPPDAQQNARERVTTREYSYEKNDLFGGNQRGSRVEKTYLQTSPAAPSGLTPATTTWTRGDGYASQATSIATGTSLASSSLPTTNDRASGSWTETTVNPDGTSVLSQYADGLAVSSTERTPTTYATLHSTTFAYDSLGRTLSVTDSRTGTTTYDENADGLPEMTLSGNLLYVREPADSGQTPRVTRVAYDKLGRRTQATLPDGTLTYTAYDAAGNTRAVWGSQSYPQRYTHDEQGRLRTLETWRDNAPSGDPANAWGADTTTWLYDLAGRLTAKRDAAGAETTYEYTHAGRLLRRLWARVLPGTTTRLATDYGYTHGFLTAVNYNDSTPDVTLTYDSLGRRDTVSNTVATTAYQYTSTDLGVDTETVTYNIPGQTAFSRVLDRADRSLGRDMGWQLLNGAAVENSATYGYLPLHGRLTTVSGLTAAGVPASSFTYGYLSQSSLVETITGPAHTITNSWEIHRDVLLAKTNHLGNPASPVSKFDYDIPLPNGTPSGLGANAIGQRTTVKTTGTAFPVLPRWTWGYDSMGQLTSAVHSATAANSRYYAYDSIGNRRESRTGTATPSGGTLTSYYATADGSNVPGANSLNQYAAINTLKPVHDLDGNMTSGRIPITTSLRTLVWDAENRLTEVKNGSTTLARYYYDAAGRRIAASVSGVTTLHLYDGWNPIAEYTGQTLSRTYLWGMDLSGSIQGAGGVGGLLAARVHGTGAATYYPTYDGNGNVSEYLNTSGVIKAHYEYDPFGNTLVTANLTTEDATLKASLSHRFSTKPHDAATGLYYYGYRWYDPVTGRWSSRDPIEEEGGLNLYGFLGNDGVDKWDVLGLAAFIYIKDKANYDAAVESQKNGCAYWKDVKIVHAPEDGVRWKVINDARISGVTDMVDGRNVHYNKGKITKPGAVWFFDNEEDYRSQMEWFQTLDNCASVCDAIMMSTLSRLSGEGLPVKPPAPIVSPGPVPFPWKGPVILGSRGGVVDLARVNYLIEAMKRGTFDFKSAGGKVAGYIDDTGRYIVTEGHHRMQAAMELFRRTGNRSFVDQLLENGVWTRGQTPPPAVPLPPIP